MIPSIAYEADAYPGCTLAVISITGFLNLLGLHFYGKSSSLKIS